ncbi:LGI2 [Symbiodinium sp. CCMP2592]|nr:LGI2 [Symbiodinium sp. CCMP2592]
MGLPVVPARLAAGIVLIWHLGLQGCDDILASDPEVSDEDFGVGLQSVFQVPFDSQDRGWEPFVMNGTQYIALAADNRDSMVYELDGTTFQEVQRLSGNIIGERVYDLEYFEVGGSSYLAVANFKGGESKVCRWEGTQFVEYQTMPLPDHSIGVTDLEDFAIDNVSYVGAAMAQSPSYVFKWNGTALEEFQSIPTVQEARSMKFFDMEGTKYLAIAAHVGGDVAIHRWSGSSFEPWKRLDAKNAVDLSVFYINDVLYLAVAEHREGPSRIYSWSGSDFEVAQSIEEVYTHAVHAFVAGGVNFLALATSGRNNRIYAWRGDKFEQVTATEYGASHSWSSFAHGDDGPYYLALAIFQGRPSEIFEFDPSVFQ